jgi:hypothetical protein
MASARLEALEGLCICLFTDLLAKGSIDPQLLEAARQQKSSEFGACFPEVSHQAAEELADLAALILGKLGEHRSTFPPPERDERD